MKESIKKAKEFIKSYNKVTFVGHSKGGAEAAANAVATNKDCIIFNPATVNLSAYGLSSKGYKGSMTAYIVKNEILNYTFGMISSPIGKKVYLKQQWGGHWYQAWKTTTLDRIMNHLMGSVKDGLKDAGYK